MTGRMVSAWINEKRRRFFRGTTLARLAKKFLPSADVFVVNGYPQDPGYGVKDGDRVVLIQKGRLPPAEELETLLAARHSPGVYDRVRKAAVGIAGLGGLGSAWPSAWPVPGSASSFWPILMGSNPAI